MRSNPTVIDLIRHGEPEGGKRYRGQIDHPLSATGWQQMWDAVGAQACGYTAFWINRAEAPLERHAAPPAFVVGSLSEVAAIVNDAG